MTIKEAEVKWHVTDKTIMNYILKGYIPNLCIENNEIILPNIKAPYVKSKPTKVSAIDSYILKAFEKEKYVNAKIVGISDEEFAERMRALVQVGKIYEKDKGNVDYTSNSDFYMGVKENRKNIGITIKPTIDIKPEINATAQVGLINLKG